MCSALEELVNEGVEKGRLEGRREGRLEGRLEGRREGILANIRVCKGFHMSKEEIVQSIMSDFSLSEKEAVDYVELYW